MGPLLLLSSGFTRTWLRENPKGINLYDAFLWRFTETFLRNPAYKPVEMSTKFMLNPAFCRQNTVIALTAAFLAISTLAGPLDKALVASDAKWVVHLDIEAFRASKLGGHIVTDILQPKIEASPLGKKSNLSINLTNVSSVTAYGPTFEKDGEGILILKTSADVKKDLDTLVGMASLSGDEEKMITMEQHAPFAIYKLKDNMLFTPMAGGTLVAAKSRQQLERAREIVSGKGETLAKTDAFKTFPDVPKGFFFLGMAQGLNDEVKIPAQAQVLREADGGRLVIGENERNVFVNLVFRGKNEESTTKIQQVMQGIVALVSMSQQNKEITELANSAKISGEGKNVSVTLHFPTVNAIERMDKHLKVNLHEHEVGVELKVDAEDEEKKDGEQEKK
jgi:hypothetical protein